MTSPGNGQSVILHQEEVQLLPTKWTVNTEAFRIHYHSDGLKVVGFIIKPKTVHENAPLIIYNRGGAEDRGLLESRQLTGLARWASQGYVLLTTQ
jgi:hypothetical protein